MRVAIIGSRNLIIPNLGKYIPPGTVEIVSGDARGVDTSAKEYANANGIKMIEFLPNYKKYGKSAPLKRNLQIIEYADFVIAFWDGKSCGTKFVIDNCKKFDMDVKVIKIKNSTSRGSCPQAPRGAVSVANVSQTPSSFLERKEA